jgi:protein-disulfide isomerase
MFKDLLARLSKTRNLMIAGGALALIGIAGVAGLGLGSGGNKQGTAAADSGGNAFGGESTKSTDDAPNVKSDYRPKGEPSGVAPKMTASKNTGDSVALNTKNSGSTGDNPLDVIAYGSAGAPVTVIEYGSFTCPHCAAFHEETLPKLKARYLDTGQVRLVYRPFFRNAFDVDAGLFIACLAPERRAAWVSLLFHQQQTWVPFGVENVIEARKKTRDNLEAYGAQAGLSAADFDRCLANQPNKDWQQAIHDQAIKEGLEGTPMFLIDGKKISTIDFDEWTKLLEPLIAKARGRN